MKVRSHSPCLAALLLFISPLLALPLRAELRLPKVFGDHMVLQHEKPVAIWGWATPGKKVLVEFGDNQETATADEKGDWSVELEPMAPNAAGRVLEVTDGEKRIAIKDVLVGEVWVCGGQSNMEWTLGGSRDADLEIDSADFPAIRYLRLPKIASATPQNDFPVKSARDPEGNWRRAVAGEVERCTAVGYYFAKRLHRRLHVPVGLIDTSWGGTMAQHWVSPETLRPIAEMKPYFEQFEAARKAWSESGGEEGARKRFEDDTRTWEKKREEARAEGKAEPRGRPNPNNYRDPASKRQPGGMYHGVLLPIAPFTVRGALFYQGENNSFAESWKPFPKTYPAVVADWRKALGDPQLPLGLIQIAGWSNRRSMTYDQNHHTNVVREVQFRTWQSTPHTGLIVTFDTNSNGSIHPARKQPVGERTARWALAEVYGVKQRGSNNLLDWRGPVFESARVEGKKMVISFQEGTRRGLRLDRDVEVGFYVAGANRQFHHARARVIKGDSLEVWAEEVPVPVAVRYGWSNLPMGGLMNGRELPAYPFRSDKWPLVPHQSNGEYRVE